MNIENIGALARQLDAIGVENAASVLLKRICFHPEKFTLERKVIKGSDMINLQFFSEKSGAVMNIFWTIMMSTFPVSHKSFGAPLMEYQF